MTGRMKGEGGRKGGGRKGEREAEGNGREEEKGGKKKTEEKKREEEGGGGKKETKRRKGKAKIPSQLTFHCTNHVIKMLRWCLQNPPSSVLSKAR